MDNQLPRSHLALSVGAMTVGVSIACGVLAPSAAHAAGTVITIGEPEGFGNLSVEQPTVVDVYFGGERVGTTTVAAAPGLVTLTAPAALVALLPPLKDRASILQALSAAHIPANPAHVCGATSDPLQCGRLEPEIAGVILDREHFRLDVFVNPRLLAAGNASRDLYVPAPARSPSLVNGIGATMSGQSGPRSATYFALHDGLLVGSGARRLRAEFSYGDPGGFEADTVALEIDRPELRFSSGALWAPGGDLAGRRRILGVSVESQIDTRVDHESLLGTPLIVFLDRRSRVDLLRDGRLIHSGIYEPGNQQIETAALPDGTYEITLRIQEASGTVREERRFFSKSRRIPSLGRTNYFAFGGLLVGTANARSPREVRGPYLAAGLARRLSEDWALEGNVECSEHLAAVQAGASFLTPPAQVRAIAVAQTDGTFGALFQIASSGSSRVNFNVDLRRIQARPEHVLAGASPIEGEPGSSSWSSGTYSQASGVVSYAMPNLRFLATGYYRQDDEGATRYSIGPALEWDLLRRGSLQLGMRTDLTLTEHGSAGFAGITLRLVGRRTAVSAVAGVRRSNVSGDPLGSGPMTGLSGGWNTELGEAQLAMTGGYEHAPQQDAMSLSGDLRHDLAALSADFARVAAENTTSDQFSLGLRSTMIAGAGIVRMASRTTAESVIVAKVDGARAGDRFEIIVNDQVEGILTGAGSVSLPFPSYRTYRVRIRPAGADLLSYDSSVRTVGLYPGTVASLVWSAAPVLIRFGRLVMPDGDPLRNATISGRSIWTETDDDGYFQLEAPEGIELTVSTRDGQSFALNLPREAPIGAAVVRLGTVECCNKPNARLGALAADTTLPLEKNQ